MTIEIKVPQLPESVTDATLVGWHKKPGETVARDENLVDLRHVQCAARPRFSENATALSTRATRTMITG